MKITNELLKKYAKGKCTDEERTLIEKWMTSDTTSEEEIFIEEFEPHEESIWKSILVKVTEKNPDTISIFRTFIKVSAAASILFATFLGGRVSANVNVPTTTNSPAKLNEHLYIYSGKKSYGNLPGELFKVQFDGRLRLYNASKKTQKLMVGDSLFTLHPERNYFLTGSTERAELTTGRDKIISTNGNNPLPSGFAILRIHR
ncbi:MAG: hypothetical protein AAGA31_17110 [Bacteroidota bacterium]